MQTRHQFLRIQGDATERGKSYGKQAQERISLNIDFYKKMFETYDIGWDKACRIASRFEGMIADYYPEAIDEMKGIALGAGLCYSDILTINCRSEILFAQPDGCSCLGVLPELSAKGHTLLGQTWDWLAAAEKTTLIVHIEQPELPTLIMVTEAGIIGGKGLNDKGIGVCLNATSIGQGQIGVPLHILYRMILNADTISNALDKVAHAKRAGSGTFNIGSAQGFLMSVEFSAENFDVLMPEDSPLCHTNHYLSPLFIAQDTFKRDLTDTFVRLNRLRRLTKAQKLPYSPETVFEFLSDHANFPDSVCSHEDSQDPIGKQLCTVYGIVMDLDDKKIWISNGKPCERSYSDFCLS